MRSEEFEDYLLEEIQEAFGQAPQLVDAEHGLLQEGFESLKELKKIVEFLQWFLHCQVPIELYDEFFFGISHQNAKFKIWIFTIQILMFFLSFEYLESFKHDFFINRWWDFSEGLAEAVDRTKSNRIL